MSKRVVKKELTSEQKKRYYVGLFAFSCLIVASSIILIVCSGLFFLGAYYGANLIMLPGCALLINIFIIGEYFLWNKDKKYLKEE